MQAVLAAARYVWESGGERLRGPGIGGGRNSVKKATVHTLDRKQRTI